MLLTRLDELYSEALNNSRRGFEHLTIVKPHAMLHGYSLPTICLLETCEYGESRCYLGTVTRKTAVSTFDSRLTLKKLRPIKQVSLKNIGNSLAGSRMGKLFDDRMPKAGQFSCLSPKLSSCVVELLASDSGNQMALETALTQLPKLRKAPDGNWAQEDAIQAALDVFGIRSNEVPKELALKNGSSSGLGLIGAYLYEDNVVHADASRLPGFDVIAPDVTGRAVFQKGDERLVVYTANKLPLENMLGVDLVYINETRGNLVMIQYKMLEPQRNDQAKGDWRYRPDQTFWDEISRMKIPEAQRPRTDYRISSNPFFFKFVKRKIVDNSHQSFLVSLDHLKHVLASSASQGSRGGIRISYDSLDGTYLRESDMTGLIRSGYVGAHRVETEALAAILDAVAKGNKAVVLAWQQRISG